jgi:hypothetical protein
MHFLEYQPPIGSLGTLDDYKQIPPEQLVAIKKEVYEEIIAKHGKSTATKQKKSFPNTTFPAGKEACQPKKLTFTR